VSFLENKGYKNADGDIFDRLLSLKPFVRLKPYREQLLYVFFGGVSTVVNIGSFWLVSDRLGVHELTANIIAWIITMAVVYTTNRKWVFRSTAHGVKAVSAELAKFLAGRLLTLAIDELMLFVFITLLALPSMPVKIASQIIVVVINYFISRIVVFRKDNSDSKAR